MQGQQSTATVAVIDDDHRIRKSLINLSNSRGLSVIAYLSAMELLQSNTIQNVRSVISDIVMRGMDGLELYRLLSQRYPGLPVILISGKDRSVSRRRLRWNYISAKAT
jgi:FixJ family two-component response regulator